jgi:hypothetical protein
MTRFAYRIAPPLLLTLTTALMAGACGSSGNEMGTGGAGGGGGGTGGAGGGAPNDPSMVSCPTPGNDNGGASAAAIANPADFSPNSNTGEQDKHALAISRTNVLDGVTMYITAGTADHTHAIELTAAQVDSLRTMTVVNVTTGPSPGATSHTHTVMIHGCGIPSN